MLRNCWTRKGAVILKALIYTLAAMLSLTAFAQTSVPQFEVASIRPHNPKLPGPTIRFQPSGEVLISGITIQNLLMFAYGLKSYQISGGPKWLETEAFDVDAKLPPGSAVPKGEKLMTDHKARLRKLIEERCQLKLRHESQLSPVYFLVVSKRGLKIEPLAAGQVPTPNKGAIEPWQIFLSSLSERVDRPVIDKTGLTGNYQIALRYTTDTGEAASMGTGRIDPTDPASSSAPSIFTALQEQLGLQLESGKAPLDVFVIGSITRPAN